MLCTVCKEREAIFFRKYSGEYLCLQCLRKSLEKRLRQAVGKYSLLKEDDNILLVLPGLETEKPAVEIFLDMERNFPGVLISCLALSKDSIEIATEFGLHLEKNSVITPLTRWDLIVEASKYAIQISESRNFTKIVIPLFLDDAIGLFLLGALKNYPPAWVINGRVLLGDQTTEPPIVTPFFRIPTEEVLLLIGKEWRPSDKLLQSIRELEIEFPGSRFNILNSYHNLFLGKNR
ncbi:MAG: hypothetical protein DRO00_01015 [Thermoproteota archaeon]|nr:MAG: hypothetical protein DRO00_01015 [Candidatus Korarchaeota archaeon]